MKIYFCDGCNESVPLPDVQSGRITTIKGKLFCPSCIPPGALSTPSAAPAAAPARAGTHPLLLLVLLALVAWTLWRDGRALLSPSGRDEAVATRDPLADLGQRLDEFGDRLRLANTEDELVNRSVTSMRAELEALRAADAEQARATERLADQLDRLARAQAEMGLIIEKVQLVENRTESLVLRMDAMSDAIAAHETALSLPQAAAAEAPAGAVAMGNGPALPAPDPARQARLEETRRLLLDPEPDLRFEGVDRVESERLAELAPELVALFADEDHFVRMHAMNVVGNFAYEPAVPALFDVLADGNAQIRKAAWETLVRLTGYDPGFAFDGSTADRNRSVQAWRDWYAAR